jgi:hypothetical protein
MPHEPSVVDHLDNPSPIRRQLCLAALARHGLGGALLVRSGTDYGRGHEWVYEVTVRVQEIMNALRDGGRLNSTDWALVCELIMMRGERSAPQKSTERVKAFRERQADETLKRVSVSQQGNIDSNNNKLKKPPISPKPLKRCTPLPEGWFPLPADLDWATGKGFPPTFTKAQTERFTNWAYGRGAARKEWSACWRNWLLKAWEEGNAGPRFQKPSNVVAGSFRKEFTPEPVRDISAEEKAANLRKLMKARPMQNG